MQAIENSGAHDRMINVESRVAEYANSISNQTVQSQASLLLDCVNLKQQDLRLAYLKQESVDLTKSSLSSDLAGSTYWQACISRCTDTCDPLGSV